MMSDQLAITETGEFLSQPLTWDNEPLYCPATIEENPLFSTDAFKQYRGQLALEDDER
jgi:hypothetical protein